MGFNRLGVELDGFGKLSALKERSRLHVGHFLSCLVVFAGRKFIQQDQGGIKVLRIDIGIQQQAFDFFDGFVFGISLHKALKHQRRTLIGIPDIITQAGIVEQSVFGDDGVELHLGRAFKGVEGGCFLLGF